MQTLFFTLIAFNRNYIVVCLSDLIIKKTKFKKAAAVGLSTLGIAKACDCDKPLRHASIKIRCGR